MTGHGSKPPGDRANDPGRKVHEETTAEANVREREDYDVHGVDAYDEGEWAGVEARRIGGPVRPASRGDSYRAGYISGHRTGTSVWDPTGETEGNIRELTGRHAKRDWDYDDYDDPSGAAWGFDATNPWWKEDRKKG